MFPTRLYHSQKAHSIAHSDLYVQQRSAAYKTYVKKWELEVKQWLKANNYSIKINKFLNLYRRELRKDDERKQEAKEAK